MVDREWCSEWGKKGKNKGIEGSANANDVLCNTLFFQKE
jgi:hypothetical protein